MTLWGAILIAIGIPLVFALPGLILSGRITRSEESPSHQDVLDRMFDEAFPTVPAHADAGRDDRFYGHPDSHAGEFLDGA